MGRYVYVFLLLTMVAFSAFNLGRYYPTETRKQIIETNNIIVCLETRINFSKYMLGKNPIKSCEEIVKDIK